MSENNLKRDYERIYLTDELGDVNWCQDRITKEDVEYVRADLATLATDDRLKRLDKLERFNETGFMIRRKRGEWVRFEQVKTIVGQWVADQEGK